MKRIIKTYKYAGKYWPFAVMCPIFMVAEAILELQVPVQIGKVIDYLKYTDPSMLEIKKILLFGVYLLGFSLLSLTCGILGGVFASIASSGFARNLKADLFRKIQAFSFENIDKYNTSSLITRMTTDTNWVQRSFQMSIRILFRSPALFIYAIIKAYQIAPDLSVVFLIAIPVIAGGLIIIFALAHPLFEKGIKRIDFLNEVVEENVRGIRVVKSFTREEDEIKKFGGVNDEIYKTFSKASKIVNLNGPWMSLAIYSVMILMAWFGSWFIVDGRMTFGNLYEMFTYSIQILASLMMLSMIFAMFIISKPSRTRVYEILEEVPTIKNKENPVMEVTDGSIEFNDVSFRYNRDSEKPVLNHINLKINSGETVGIIGSTGSSKTTLISLIARLYEANEGEVKVGGINVQDYDIETLRDAVSVVLQKNVLFSGTITSNLRWGKKDATIDEIIEACNIAQASSFIESMPDKYDSIIEQGGTNVSGGQKQRLCIARAILKDPKILILDDSMSAVDTRTDSLIREGLKEYRPNITKLIVAQRCQSVMNADKIVIINEGEIIAVGKHEELLKDSKVYQEIYYSQNKVEA